jgi:N-acetylmuramoyl-L-alanine amidase
MERKELGKELNLQIVHIPTGSNNRPGEITKKSFITIHQTDNTHETADVAAHIRFLNDGGSYEHNGRLITTSWHYTVDDNCCANHLPIEERGWHAANKEGNDSSIGIEICMHRGIDQESAYRRAEKLVACLCYDLDLDPDNCIVPHRHWSGKFCPSLLLSGSGQTGWGEFKINVKSIVKSFD